MATLPFDVVRLLQAYSRSHFSRLVVESFGDRSLSPLVPSTVLSSSTSRRAFPSSSHSPPSPSSLSDPTEATPTPANAAQANTFHDHHVTSSNDEFPLDPASMLIAEDCLACTLALVSLPNLLLLFRSLLLEHSLVVVSSNVAILSAVVLSLVPLLHPYVWQGPFIPILPDDMRDYLCAPVPFIIGVTSLDCVLIGEMSDCLILDLDLDKATSLLSCVAELPGVEKLECNLTPYYDVMSHYRESKRAHPFVPSFAGELSCVRGVLQEFCDYQTSFLCSLAKRVPDNPSTPRSDAHPPASPPTTVTFSSATAPERPLSSSPSSMFSYLASASPPPTPSLPSSPGSSPNVLFSTFDKERVTNVLCGDDVPIVLPPPALLPDPALSATSPRGTVIHLRPFVIETVLREISPSDISFVRDFLRTQLFDMHLPRFLALVESIRRQRKELVEKVLSHIRTEEAKFDALKEKLTHMDADVLKVRPPPRQNADGKTPLVPPPHGHAVDTTVRRRQLFMDLYASQTKLMSLRSSLSTCSPSPPARRHSSHPRSRRAVTSPALHVNDGVLPRLSRKDPVTIANTLFRSELV